MCKYLFHRYSLRENLNRGEYKIRVYISKYDKLKSCEVCRKYLEFYGNEFLFRLAASKQCVVKKSINEENDEIEKVLFDWHARLIKYDYQGNSCNIL